MFTILPKPDCCLVKENFYDKKPLWDNDVGCEAKCKFGLHYKQTKNLRVIVSLSVWYCKKKYCKQGTVGFRLKYLALRSTQPAQQF